MIGECMVELRRRPGTDSADPVLHQGFGGDTANTAVYLARIAEECGCGLHVEYLTALGDDRHSSRMRSWLHDEGVGTALTRTVPGRRPGLYLVELDEHGERSFAYWRGESAARELLATPDSVDAVRPVTTANLVYLSGITLAVLSPAARIRLHGLLDELRARGGRVAFDPNYRPALWRDPDTARQASTDLLRRTDVALPTFADEHALFGDAGPADTVDRLRATGVAEVVVKDGAAGAVLASADGVETVAAQPVHPVVDSTAAGDAFNAAYLHERAHGRSPASAALAGHRLAAVVIAHPGAVIPREAMPALPAPQSVPAKEN